MLFRLQDFTVARERYDHAMRAAASLLLVACQTHAPVASRVEVAAPKSSSSAASSAEPAALHQPSSSLAVVARFAQEVTVAVFPLGHDALVSQASATAWSATALDRDNRPTSMIVRPGAHFEIFQAGGSSATNAWITTMDENAFPTIRFETWHVDGASATKRDARFLVVGELRPGQWVALPSHLLPAYLYDEVPSKFENVAGAADVPKVPSAIRLTQVAFLGDGHVCAVGITKKASGGFDMVAWNDEGGDVTLGFDDAAQGANVARGRGGECIVLRPHAKTTDVGRFHGGSIAWSTIDWRAARVSAAPSGTLWLWDDERRELARTTNADASTLTRFEMPRDVPECPHLDDVTSIAATSDDDALLAVRGACTNEGAALVRTSPRVPIQKFPAP